MKTLGLLLALITQNVVAQPNPVSGTAKTIATTGGALSVTSLTATSFSSAPVVYTSSQNIHKDFLEWFDKDGTRAMLYDGAGGVRGLRINPATVETSGTADLDLYGYANGGPILQFRRNDSSVSAKDDLMKIAVRDHDSSTGGEGEKASYKVIAGEAVWDSNSPMEQWHTWGLTRKPDAQADYMVLSSTGLLIVGYPGSVAESKSSCSTCTLQVISPANHGVDIVGTLAISSTVYVKSTSSITFTGTTPTMKVDTGTYEIVIVAMVGTTAGSATCPDGKRMIGGGLAITGTATTITQSYPANSTQWGCTTTIATNFNCYAICMSIN